MPQTEFKVKLSIVLFLRKSERKSETETKNVEGISVQMGRCQCGLKAYHCSLVPN